MVSESGLGPDCGPDYEYDQERLVEVLRLVDCCCPLLTTAVGMLLLLDIDQSLWTSGETGMWGGEGRVLCDVILLLMLAVAADAK